MNFMFTPFICFSLSTDTGVDSIPLNSHVQILDDGSDDTRLIYVTALTSMTGSSTVADLLSATGNYTNILTNNTFLYTGNLVDDTSPTLGADLEGDENQLQSAIFGIREYKVIDIEDIEVDNEVTLNATDNNNYVIDMSSVNNVMKFTLEDVSTITEGKVFCLYVKNADSEHTLHFNISQFAPEIIWENELEGLFEANEDYIVEFTASADNTYYARYTYTNQASTRAYNILGIKNTYPETKSISTQVSDCTGIYVKPDGTRLYTMNGVDDDVDEYSMSPAYDLSSLTWVESKAVTTTIGEDLYFSPTGDSFFILDNGNSLVRQWDMDPAWDISTATSGDTLSYSSQSYSLYAMTFKSDGSKIYLSSAGASPTIYEYSLNTDWDLASISYLGNTKQVTGFAGAKAIAMSADNTKLIMTDYYDRIHQVTLTTPGNITSINQNSLETIHFTLDRITGYMEGVCWANSGTNLFIGTDSDVYKMTTG